jgi:hypothetical protein
MRTVLRIAPFIAASLCFSSQASAFTLGSRVTTSCHEVLTFEALSAFVAAIDPDRVVLPEDDSWKKVAHDIAVALAATNPDAPKPEAMSEAQQFLLWSLVVGVRSPDVEGHSVADLATLRIIQADPSATGQYLHALRATTDDDIEGDIAAVAGAKNSITNTLHDARDALDLPSLIDVTFALDFYGVSTVTVNRIAYQLGRAAHTLQDSHAHMLRSDDALTVLSVSNYLQAIDGTLNEARDGLAHSTSMDDCSGPIDTVTARAKQATLGLALACKPFLNGDDAALEKGFAACDPDETQLETCGWINYNPPCGEAVQAGDSAARTAACCVASNAYCGTKWLSVFREKQSEPYLEAIFGCSVASPRRASGALAFAFGFLLAAVWLRRRAGMRSAGLLALGVLLWASSAHAAPRDAAESNAVGAPERSGAGLARRYFAELEGHLSLFNDAPDASLVNVTFGYALRGGYRFARWAIIAAVERNYWLPSEYPGPVAAGTLNIGVGAEYRYAGGFARSSAVIGPSILLFDTTYHNAGHTGVYLDLRPIGVRYEIIEHLAIAFDPLTVAYIQPVISSKHAIRQLEYRTLLGVECVF